ncbi:hypothetical protein MMC29_006810 [Sticta canariensis]|nr:hypothetical protein [Sticta canariensis]
MGDEGIYSSLRQYKDARRSQAPNVTDGLRRPPFKPLVKVEDVEDKDRLHSGHGDGGYGSSEYLHATSDEAPGGETTTPISTKLCIQIILHQTTLPNSVLYSVLYSGPEAGIIVTDQRRVWMARGATHVLMQAIRMTKLPCMTPLGTTHLLLPRLHQTNGLINGPLTLPRSPGLQQRSLRRIG